MLLLVTLAGWLSQVAGWIWRHPFDTHFNIIPHLTTFLIINRLEKAAKAEKEESSEQENPREHLNLDQAGLDFR